MTTANLSALPYFTILDANGITVPGGKCWTYAAGTSTLKDSYTDYDSGIVAANPIIADSAARLEIWLSGDGLYKLTFTDASDNIIRTVDHVGTGGGGSGVSLLVNTVIGATGSVRALAAAAATSVTALGYRSVSDNGGGTFRWDASASGGDNGATVNGNTTYGSTGRWIRLIEGDCNPRWWGCYGNGTDADQSYMTLAIAYALANSKAIHLTQGTYLLSAAVTFSVPVVYDSGAILSFTSFSPAITPIIGINDTSKHFSLPADDTYTPVFPAGTIANPLWFGGEENLYAVRQAMKSVSTSGGTVLIPDGTHSTATQVTAYSNVSLIGQGSGSILSVNSGWTTDEALVGNDTATAVVENFHVNNLQLLGRDSSCSGIKLLGKNSSIKNCTVKNFKFDGIVLGGTLAAADSTDVEVSGNTLIDNGSVATSKGHIRLLSGNQLSVHDNQLRSTTVPSFGIYVESSETYPQSVANGIVKDNNLLNSNIAVAGYDGESGGLIDNLVIEGNHIEGGTQVDDGITFGVAKGGEGPTGQVRVANNVISVYGSGCNGINLVGIQDNPDSFDIADNSILLNASDTSSAAIRIENQVCYSMIHGNIAIASSVPSAAALIREVGSVSDASYNSNMARGITGGYVLVGRRYEVLGTSLISEYNADTTAVANLIVNQSIVNTGLNNLLKAQIAGLELTRDGTSLYSVTPGTASTRTTDGTYYTTTVGATLQKNIANVWAAGAAGGRASALTLTSYTWYHVFLLGKSSSSTSYDCGVDTSLTATNLLADATDYNTYRRIGSILYGSATLQSFTQVGDYFYQQSGTGSPAQTTSTDTTAATHDFTITLNPPDQTTASVPPGVKIYATLSVVYSSAAEVHNCYLGEYGAQSNLYGVTESSAGLRNQIFVWTDTSSRIAASSAGSQNLYIQVPCYMDPRGKF